MPIVLIHPRAGKTPYYAGRGHHFGIYVNQSTKARSPSQARKIIRQWERDIERGVFAPGDGSQGAVSFAEAALTYMNAGGAERPVTKLLLHFGETPIVKIGQKEIDTAALTLFPDASPATRNREVYTPMSAILKRAGREFQLKRPKGGNGTPRVRWLWPEQASAILIAAHQLDKEFGIFLDQLLFGGLRLSEQLGILCNDIKLTESFAWTRKTKNSDPQPVHLTPYMVASLANHPRGVDRHGERVFRFHKGGELDWKLMASCAMASGLPKPARWKSGERPPRPAHALDWVTFHVFRHTYGTWMRRYGGLDEIGLLNLNRWKSKESVIGYAHTIVSEESRRADLLPTPKVG